MYTIFPASISVQWWFLFLPPASLWLAGARPDLGIAQTLVAAAAIYFSQVRCVLGITGLGCVLSSEMCSGQLGLDELCSGPKRVVCCPLCCPLWLPSTWHFTFAKYDQPKVNLHLPNVLVVGGDFIFPNEAVWLIHEMYFDDLAASLICSHTHPNPNVIPAQTK